MKNILSRWILLLLSAIILPACSDSDNPAMPDEEPESPVSPPAEPLSPFQEIITQKTWKGEYGYYQGPLLTVDFNPDGSGTMIYHDDRNRKEITYLFTYNINKPYIECKGTLTYSPYDETDFTMKFELRDNRLFPLAEDFNMFVLGQNEVLKTNSYGTVLSDMKIYGEDGLAQIWIHEDGLKIIDFRSLFSSKDHRLTLIKLSKKGEKDFEFCYYPEDTPYAYSPPWYEEEYFKIHNYDYEYFEWRVMDSTGDKLVLYGSDGIQTYYSGQPSDLPQVTDVKEVLNSTNSWICYSSSSEGDIVFSRLNLNSDGSFCYSNRYEGYYSYTDTEITLNFTKAIVWSDEQNCQVDIAPLTWTSPLTIYRLSCISFEIPGCGREYFYGEYDRNVW